MKFAYTSKAFLSHLLPLVPPNLFTLTAYVIWATV